MRIECGITTLIAFQHTAARRRLVSKLLRSVRLWSFQHTAARRRLGLGRTPCGLQPVRFQHTAARRRLEHLERNRPILHCFNTQPPEGGWLYEFRLIAVLGRFNTQPPEGGWIKGRLLIAYLYSFNTQPPEGGWRFSKARSNRHCEFQHTAARRRLGIVNETETSSEEFQHTAARRRLVSAVLSDKCRLIVSTHSRPKAAGLK